MLLRSSSPLNATWRSSWLPAGRLRQKDGGRELVFTKHLLPGGTGIGRLYQVFGSEHSLSFLKLIQGNKEKPSARIFKT